MRLSAQPCAEPASKPSTCHGAAPADPASDAFSADLVMLTEPLRQRAYRLTHDATEADDLLQETMVRAWSARSSFQTGTNLRAWTWTIMRNLYFSRVRRSGRLVALSERDTENLASIGADQHAQAELQEVIRAIDHLPRNQRSAIRAVALEGLDYEAAADRLNLSKAALKSRVCRARAALVRLLENNRTCPDQPPSGVTQPVFAPPVEVRRFRGIWTAAKSAGQPLWIG
jgi:RNA polymerase sigma-70 factor (ECF subfamily)